MRRALVHSVALSVAPRFGAFAFASPFLTMTAAPLTSMRMHATHWKLRDALLRKFKEEKTNCKMEQPKIPDGFTVNRAPGSPKFLLTKKFSDETLEVLCHVTEKETRETTMTLFVTKGSQALRFELASVVNLAYNDILRILEVAHFEDAAMAKDLWAKGTALRPDCRRQLKSRHQFDEGVNIGFHCYLEDRGINDDFATFIVEYILWIKQQDYENWLGCVSKFLSLEIPT
jgi:complement component 1 Q subcomponent-binding protein